MTYASETWVLKEITIQKLLVFERKILKRNIWVYERKSNTEDKKIGIGQTDKARYCQQHQRPETKLVRPYTKNA